MPSAPPVLRDLVLVGGGHAHVAVVKGFGMKPMSGVRVTLVSRDVETPYSGMLPGLVAGAYSSEECHIDLRRLCSWAGVRLVHAPATGPDLRARAVLLPDARPPLAFDVLSLDVGAAPTTAAPGAAEHATPVKPIDGFAARWEALRARAAALPAGAPPPAVAVVGGGAGGTELALALAACALPLRVSLFAGSRGLLPTHAAGARARVAAALATAGVAVVEGLSVAAVSAAALTLSDGSARPCDAALWCTQAAAPPWLAAAGLACDAGGCVRVGRDLQSLSHPGVFAAGDCAHLEASPRPKAGVYAVRAGPPLARNLRRALEGRQGEPWRPQRHALALLSLGPGAAVASYGSVGLGGSGWLGRALWRWKDRIDRKWLALYTQLPPMPPPGAMPSPPPISSALVAAAGAGAAEAVAAAGAMRCGGCGAKVGATPLRQALARLSGAAAGDDCAVLPLPAGRGAVLGSLDFFPAFFPGHLDDPFVLGACAAAHALSDAAAMGALPAAALALAQLPAGLPPGQQERELLQLLAGAAQVLTAAGCALVGGHSVEGPALGCGFAVVATAAEGTPSLAKGGLAAGQVLLLTKRLGTGVILAANARALAPGRAVAAALDSIRTPSFAAAAILADHGCTGATDVTGFGLAGHAVEMARASGVRVAIHVEALPLLPAAAQLAAGGVASSLAPANRDAAEAAELGAGVEEEPAFPLVFDPQTGGGLLAGVPAERAEAALAALQANGYPHAAAVGVVLPLLTGARPLVLQTR